MSIKNFRFTCAKNNERTELIIQAESIDSAKESLHKQGYTIIE
ncbi:MAG TPA: hypothetical protein PK765_01150 [bacterium]|nr:hypothetical protein [bacterium]